MIAEDQRAAFAMQRSLQIQEHLSQELQQARETIVLMSEAALAQQREIARLREALEEIEPLRMALLNIRDTVESCYVAGGWVSMDEEEIAALSDIANDALGGPAHDRE